MNPDWDKGPNKAPSLEISQNEKATGIFLDLVW